MSHALADGIFDDLPVDKPGCKLLGPTALVVQGLMGILVITSLVYKRHRESPKRPWRIWSVSSTLCLSLRATSNPLTVFASSNFVILVAFVHGVNVLISGVIAEVSAGNACVTYFLNILIDTTLGVAIIYFILHISTFFLTEKCHLKGFESGEYGSPPSLSYWARQAAVYVFALTTMKALVIGLFALWPGIFKLGEWLLGFLGPSNAAQVIFTMGIFPIMMNILQFWLIDSIVKANAHGSFVALPTDTPRRSLEEEEEEPLFQVPSDDEEDAHSLRSHDIENPPLVRSLSKSSTLREPKPSSGDASATASGSITPKDIENGGAQSIAMHAYPPSRGASPSSTSSSRRKRRSPPPPLSLSPRPSPIPSPAVNPLTPPQAAKPNPAPPNHDDDKEWASWDDEVDDWAGKVGQEEWTGKRLEGMKNVAREVWGEDAGGSLPSRTRYD